MPERNPFEETMRAGQMNVPQRTTTRQTRGPAGMGFAPPASTEYGEGPIRPGREIRSGFGGGPIMGYEDPTGPTRPPGQPISGRHIGYGGPRPLRTGFGGGPIMGYEDPAIDRASLYGDTSSYDQMLAGLIAQNPGQSEAEILAGEPDWSGQLQSEIGGYGTVQPVGHTSDDKAYKALWSEANKNVNPEGRTPLDVIKREWNRLKEVYHNKKYGGSGPSGSIGQKIGKLGKFAGKWGGRLGAISGLGYLADILSPSNIMGFKGTDFEEGTYDPGAQLSLRRGGIASLIRRL